MEELVLSRDAVRDLDRRAIEECGIPSLLLMENAGRACAFEASRMLEGAPGGPVVVLCGPGNNGGDGLVVARTLANHGRSVRVLFSRDEAKLAEASEDVATNARLWRGLGGTIEHLEGEAGPAAEALAGAVLAVDALFGTGLTKPLREDAAGLVRALNASGLPVLAVDVPSGLDADTGEVLGEAVRAEATVTFVARKPGFARGAGPRCAGRVVVAEIGIPRAWIADAARRTPSS